METSKEAGETFIEVSKDKSGLKQFIIQAFGKKHVLSKEELNKLKDFPLSSLRTTHEAGYNILGGYTVAASFHKVYYNDAKELYRDEIAISVMKKGLVISDSKTKKLETK